MKVLLVLLAEAERCQGKDARREEGEQGRAERANALEQESGVEEEEETDPRNSRGGEGEPGRKQLAAAAIETKRSALNCIGAFSISMMFSTWK